MLRDSLTDIRSRVARFVQPHFARAPYRQQLDRQDGQAYQHDTSRRQADEGKMPEKETAWVVGRTPGSKHRLALLTR